MKTLKFVAFTFLIGLFASCSKNVSINRISVEVLNKDKAVEVGDQLMIDILARDDEGIDYLLIEIPVLAISQKIQDYSEDDRWKLEKHFLVSKTDKRGDFDIYFTLMDKGGEAYLEVEPFSIR